MLPRGVTGRGPKESTLTAMTGPSGSDIEVTGHRTVRPQGFPCLTLQAVTKPPPGADAHTNPPVKTLEHSQCACCAEVAGSCRVACLHEPRAHEQRYVNANRLIFQQTSRASHRALRLGRWLRGRLADEQDGAASVVCNRPLPASSWISEKEGRWCKGKHDKESSGSAGGRPRAMYRVAVWHAGSACRSLAQSACE